MKRMLLLIVPLIVLLTSRTNAQLPTGQGSITIKNETNCTVTWNVVAICPDNPCSEWSTFAMNLIGPTSVNPSLPSTLTFSPTSSGPYTLYPWPLGSEPPCSNWTWAYAEVLIGCDDGSLGYYRVGYQDCTGIPMASVIQGCTCDGRPVIIDFGIVLPWGNAELRIRH